VVDLADVAENLLRKPAIRSIFDIKSLIKDIVNLL
jgi:hypothetical protein